MKIIKMEQQMDGDRDWLVTIEVPDAIAGQIGSLVNRCVVILDAASLGAGPVVDAEFDDDEPDAETWRVSIAGGDPVCVKAPCGDLAVGRVAGELGVMGTVPFVAAPGGMGATGGTVTVDGDTLSVEWEGDRP